ncbi:MAG: aminodeoxychorismate synthase component I [Arenimonas sp.]
MMHTRTLPADIDLLALQRVDPKRYPLLLESVAGGNPASRWDLLLLADGSGLQLDADGRTHDLQGAPLDGSFLELLDDQWRQQRRPRSESEPPFRGGWALFLAYELAAQIEPVLQLVPAPGPLPVALALRCPAAIARDRSSGRCLVVVEQGREGVLASLGVDLEKSTALPAASEWQPPVSIIEDAGEAFIAGVERVHAYLRAGDVFQVNLSRAWRARFAKSPDPAMLYSRLRDANPAPFAGLLMFGDWALLSSSPERLVCVRAGVAETRPIAGTRPRLAEDDDVARIRELVAHPKERAEHIMLIDLERNDLGRVCRPGSVHVDEMMTVETYAHVHHLVSNVCGHLREDVSPGQVIAAVFPGGTITGCPKVRCMQIISELEDEGRGPYTGALGYLNCDGDMDLNILIRSAWMSGTQLQLRAGAGLVVDSIAASELEETRAKARGLLRALGPG